MNKFKNSRTTSKLMSFIGTIILFPLGLVIVTSFCPLLNSPGSVQGMAFSSPDSLNQELIIEPEELKGTWTWYTNPLSDKHKWSGSFTITITDEDKRNNGFSGSYSDGNKIEHGRFGRTGIIWHRMTGKDEVGQNMQTWTVNKIEHTKNNNIKMWGRWRGAFDKCCDNKGDDFEFAAIKQ